MPKNLPTEPKIKTEIITKIRNEGLSVTEPSTTNGISSKSIYTWLREGVGYIRERQLTAVSGS